MLGREGKYLKWSLLAASATYPFWLYVRGERDP
jgi:hypothetical protein